jgi:uncharacterized protein (UPF0218 family)
VFLLRTQDLATLHAIMFISAFVILLYGNPEKTTMVYK